MITARKCADCGRALEPIQGEKFGEDLLCHFCARLARWRDNHPGEDDPFWATGGTIPERLKLEELRTFAFRHMRHRPTRRRDQ